MSSLGIRERRRARKVSFPLKESGIVRLFAARPWHDGAQRGAVSRLSQKGTPFAISAVAQGPSGRQNSPPVLPADAGRKRPGRSSAVSPHGAGTPQRQPQRPPCPRRWCCLDAVPSPFAPFAHRDFLAMPATPPGLLLSIRKPPKEEGQAEAARAAQRLAVLEDVHRLLRPSLIIPDGRSGTQLLLPPRLLLHSSFPFSCLRPVPFPPVFLCASRLLVRISLSFLPWNIRPLPLHLLNR